MVWYQKTEIYVWFQKMEEYMVSQPGKLNSAIKNKGI